MASKPEQQYELRSNSAEEEGRVIRISSSITKREKIPMSQYNMLRSRSGKKYSQPMAEN